MKTIARVAVFILVTLFFTSALSLTQTANIKSPLSSVELEEIIEPVIHPAPVSVPPALPQIVLLVFALPLYLLNKWLQPVHHVLYLGQAPPR